MKNKVLSAWAVAAVLVGGSASAAVAEPVWKELENYSEKDKAYLEKRSPQLQSVDKELAALQAKPVNRATAAMIEELEAKKKQLVGELTEHEFRLSGEVAGFANARSKDAEDRLKRLRGTDSGQPKELEAFEERVKRERAALEEELKKLPPDEEEVAREALKEKLRQISNEEDERIRKIPAGPRKLKRDAFEKRVAEERNALKEKLGIPASPAAPAPAGAQDAVASMQ